MSCIRRTDRSRGQVAAVLAVATMLVGSPARAQPPAGPPRLENADARAAQEEGEQAFNEGRYDDASEAFERAYAIEPAAFLLFTRAQAERLAERCDRAVELFSAYIDSGPSQKAASMALERIHLCGGEYVAKVEQPDPSSEPGPEPEPAPKPARPQEPEGPSDSDTTIDASESGRVGPRPWALIGTGGVLVAGGTGLLIATGVTAGRANTVFAESQAQRLNNTARGLAIGGAAVLSVGTALLVAGIVDAVRSRNRAQLATRPR